MSESLTQSSYAFQKEPSSETFGALAWVMNRSRGLELPVPQLPATTLARFTLLIGDDHQVGFPLLVDKLSSIEDDDVRAGVRMDVCGFPDVDVELFSGRSLLEIRAPTDEWKREALKKREISMSKVAMADDIAGPAMNPEQVSAESELTEYDIRKESAFDDADLEEKINKDEEDSKHTDGIRQYFKKIGKISLLTAEDEVNLAKQIEAGLYAAHKLEGSKDRSTSHYILTREQKLLLAIVKREGESAQENMIEANLRLVVSIAKRYRSTGMSFQDIISEGNLGLIRAVQKFDYAKGGKFSTYATWWIRHAIGRALADQAKIIRVPIREVEKINKMRRIMNELELQLDRGPTEDELAKEMGISADKIVDLRNISRHPISLEHPLGTQTDAGTIGDLIVDEDAEDPVEAFLVRDRIARLNKALDTLAEREALIIRLRYGLGEDGEVHTLNEIGKKLDLSRHGVGRILSIIKAKMQHLSRSGELYD